MSIHDSEEAYSPEMTKWVQKQLRQASAKNFTNLYRYYQTRKGPGLALAEAEHKAREFEKLSHPLSIS